MGYHEKEPETESAPDISYKPYVKREEPLTLLEFTVGCGAMGLGCGIMSGIVLAFLFVIGFGIYKLYDSFIG